MWMTKPVPPTRYEAILKAIEITDAAIDNTADDYTARKLLLQRLRLVEALADDEDIEEEDEEDTVESWKCSRCDETGETKATLAVGDNNLLLCPSCGSSHILYNMSDD